MIFQLIREFWQIVESSIKFPNQIFFSVFLPLTSFRNIMVLIMQCLEKDELEYSVEIWYLKKPLWNVILDGCLLLCYINNMWKINYFSFNKMRVWLMGTGFVYWEISTVLVFILLWKENKYWNNFSAKWRFNFLFSPRFCFLAHNFPIHLQPANTIKNLL